MAKRSKRYDKLIRQVDPDSSFELADAIKRVKHLANAKFQETIELAIKLDIDPKQANQQIRGSYLLPHSVGKMKRVIAFCPPDMVEAALAAGATRAGLDDLASEIQKGWMDFDVAVATPESRRVVGKLGRILGARGLMPNPKSGTVGEDIPKLVKEFSAGKIEYRNDSSGNIHVPVGSVAIEDSAILENIKAIYMHILERRPAAVKGTYVSSAHICSTMGPSLKLKPITRD